MKRVERMLVREPRKAARVTGMERGREGGRVGKQREARIVVDS